jgi:hypothetical protein
MLNSGETIVLFVRRNDQGDKGYFVGVRRVDAKFDAGNDLVMGPQFAVQDFKNVPDCDVNHVLASALEDVKKFL